MTLLRTSFFNGVAVVVKMATLLGLNKLLAMYVGPDGYAAIGNFQNAAQMINTIASGAIQTGVVKYTAEYNHDKKQQLAVWRTTGTIALIGSALTGILIVLLSKEISCWLLKSKDYQNVFIWLAVGLLFSTINSMLLAILNGKKQIVKYVICNIAGSLFSLLVTGVLAMRYGLFGALTALGVYSAFSFVVTVLVCRNTDWFQIKSLFGRLDTTVVKKLGKYTAMALTTAACVPISHIFVRRHLTDTLGSEAGGYWEGIWRISSAYLMLVTNTLSLYYLPRLSEIKTVNEIKKEIICGYKLILPVTVFCSLTIYLMRDTIISIVFTPKFLAMRELFALQMVGDSLKIGSWILAYLMLGKAMVWVFVISEIVFAFGFYFLACACTSVYGLVGVTLAHAINYGVYWIVIAILIWKIGVEEEGNKKFNV